MTDTNDMDDQQRLIDDRSSMNKTKEKELSTEKATSYVDPSTGEGIECYQTTSNIRERK